MAKADTFINVKIRVQVLTDRKVFHEAYETAHAAMVSKGIDEVTASNILSDYLEAITEAFSTSTVIGE